MEVEPDRRSLVGRVRTFEALCHGLHEMPLMAARELWTRMEWVLLGVHEVHQAFIILVGEVRVLVHNLTLCVLQLFDAIRRVSLAFHLLCCFNLLQAC